MARKNPTVSWIALKASELLRRLVVSIDNRYRIVIFDLTVLIRFDWGAFLQNVQILKEAPSLY